MAPRGGYTPVRPLGIMRDGLRKMNEAKRLSATVYGRVQGVSFRHYTRLEAQELGVTGWVANQPDGTVKVVAEGEKAQLEKLVSFLQEGPRMARVESVDLSWSEATGEFQQFGVRWM